MSSTPASPTTPVVQRPQKKLQPVIQIDTREQRPLEITAYPVEIVTLPVGDYGIRGFSDWENPGFAVERKSLNDLTGSLGKGRDRFFREIEKLRQFRFRALLIEADQAAIECRAYMGDVSPASIQSSLEAIEVRAGLHILWAGDPTGAARRLEGLVRQFVRGIEKDWSRLHVWESGEIENSNA